MQTPKESTIMPQAHKPWTRADKKLVRQEYSRTWASKVELANKLGRTPLAISGIVGKLNLTRRSRRWKETDLQFLSDNYGLLSDEEICRRLKRTRNGIVLKARRRLHINRKMAFYTAREVAKQTGVG